MLFLVVILIALGWAGWLWAWGRDRYVAGDLGLPPNPFISPPASRLAAPNSWSGARQRRREVLGTLALCCVLGAVLAQAWSPMWVFTVASLGLLLWYGWAVYRLEVGGTDAARESIQKRFAPVPESDPTKRVREPLAAKPSRESGLLQSGGTWSRPR